MARKCFISFKGEDIAFKLYIQNDLKIDIVDKSLNTPIQSYDEDYIMRKIREDYLSDSTVTIHLIGERSAENLGTHEQRFIKRELQASLYNGQNNTRNGVLGIVLPNVKDKIIGGNYNCLTCGNSHNGIHVNDSTTIKEFHKNYYIPTSDQTKCSWADDERYCILTSWDEFLTSPEFYIEEAFKKRAEPISNKVIVKPK
ncbi:MAG: TIR domain-containing protein [Balneola sp.]